MLYPYKLSPFKFYPFKSYASTFNSVKPDQSKSPLINRLLPAQTALGFSIAIAIFASGSQAALEEIVVTAQKRQESQQDVPISVSSFTGQGLSDFQTAELSALSGSAPNVQISHFGNTPHGAVFNIRGMGVIEPDPYAGQTVTTVLVGFFEQLKFFITGNRG